MMQNLRDIIRMIIFHLTHKHTWKDVCNTEFMLKPFRPRDVENSPMTLNVFLQHCPECDEKRGIIKNGIQSIIISPDAAKMMLQNNV